jgi:hypothetical protein
MLGWRFVLASTLLFVMLVSGCSVVEAPAENPRVEELASFPKLKVTASGYWYRHAEYTYTPYLGNPDSPLEVLASVGIIPNEVWASTGELCIQNGDTISLGYTFIMRTEKDYGHSIYHNENSWSPFMFKVNRDDEWAFQFEPCDTGRQVKHYRFRFMEAGF